MFLFGPNLQNWQICGLCMTLITVGISSEMLSLQLEHNLTEEEKARLELFLNKNGRSSPIQNIFEKTVKINESVLIISCFCVNVNGRVAVVIRLVTWLHFDARNEWIYWKTGTCTLLLSSLLITDVQYKCVHVSAVQARVGVYISYKKVCKDANSKMWKTNCFILSQCH